MILMAVKNCDISKCQKWWLNRSSIELFICDYCDIFVRFHGVPKALHGLMTDAFFSIIIMATSVLIFYNLSSSCTLVNIHCDNLKMLYLLAITYFFYIKCFVYFVCFCISFNIQKILYKTGLNFLDTNLLKKKIQGGLDLHHLPAIFKIIRGKNPQTPYVRICKNSTSANSEN